MRLRDFSLPVSAILLCAGSGLAPADTITFSAAAGQSTSQPSFTGCPAVSGTSSIPVAFSSTCGDAHGVGTASGGADFGHVGAMASVLDLGFDSLPVQMAGGASFSDDGFIFTATGLGGPSSIPVSLNLVLAGIINSTGNAQALLDIQVILNGTGIVLIHSGGPVSQCGSGCSVGVSSGTTTTLTTSQVLVPLGQPVRLQELISATAAASSHGDSATVDFAHSLDFPVGSDLFNLPAGFTVNEPGMFVFNNRFGAPTAVPEPSSLLLLGLPAVLPLFRRYRMASR